MTHNQDRLLDGGAPIQSDRDASGKCRSRFTARRFCAPEEFFANFDEWLMIP
jgi:hypothetical protein